MIFGKLELKDRAIHTHNDSYVTSTITAVSTRRPFCAAGIMIGSMSAGFAIRFWDILYPGERIATVGLSAAAIWAGLTIGRLQLVSRDLRGSELAEAVYGTYRDLNRRRRIIAEVVENASRGDAS